MIQRFLCRMGWHDWISWSNPELMRYTIPIIDVNGIPSMKEKITVTRVEQRRMCMACKIVNARIVLPV